MNLVCDESIELPVVERLRHDGHQVVYVSDADSGASDDVVLAQAAAARSLLVTADKDFGELVFRQGRASQGVLLIRLAGLSNHRKAEIVAEAIVAHGSELFGSFSVVSAGQVRIRKQL